MAADISLTRRMNLKPSWYKEGAMFDKQYRFKGRHALRVDKLTEVFDELSKAKLIDRNVDV